MAGTYPASPDFMTVNLSSNYSILVSRAQNGKTYTRDIGGHIWTISGSYENLTRSEQEIIYGFLQSQQGSLNSFLIGLSDKNTPRGIATGAPLVNGASQSGVTLITDGWTVSQTGIMKSGDIITLAGSNKVYMLNADSNSDGSGNATLNISPSLTESPADNAIITVNNVKFTVINKNEQFYSGKAPYFYDISIDFEEYI